MIRNRRLRGVAAAFLAVSAVLSTSGASQATTQDCKDPHCYGAPYSSNGVAGANWRGVHATMQLNWRDAGLSTRNNLIHIGSAIWENIINSDYCIEGGIANGFIPGNGARFGPIRYIFEAGSGKREAAEVPSAPTLRSAAGPTARTGQITAWTAPASPSNITM
jgi:hypothetical protein